MEKLLKLIDKQIKRAFPNTFIGLILDYSHSKNTVYNFNQGSITGQILLKYKLKERVIVYRLASVNYTSVHSDAKEIFKFVEEMLEEVIVNNLLFSLGSINIVSLLSGKSLPEEELIVY